MDRKTAEQGVNAETAVCAAAVSLCFYKESWYARQDSNLRPLAPEASGSYVLSMT